AVIAHALRLRKQALAALLLIRPAQRHVHVAVVLTIGCASPRRHARHGPARAASTATLSSSAAGRTRLQAAFVRSALLYSWVCAIIVTERYPASRHVVTHGCEFSAQHRWCGIKCGQRK